MKKKPETEPVEELVVEKASAPEQEMGSHFCAWCGLKGDSTTMQSAPWPNAVYEYVHIADPCGWEFKNSRGLN
jgi:hypothetical protein